MNASASTQEICVSACMLSSFPHALSNRRLFGDSTMINALPSIFQSCCLFTSSVSFYLILLPQSTCLQFTYPSVSMHIFSSVFDLVSLLIYSFLLVSCKTLHSQLHSLCKKCNEPSSGAKVQFKRTKLQLEHLT